MKLAVSGKGGVGKTTFSSMLIRCLDDLGNKILAIDADPDANLASALGIKKTENIYSINEMKDLILERTKVKTGSFGGYFKLNPRVDDLPDMLSTKKDNIKFIKLGSIKKGGAGCICPKTTLLKALVTHMIINRNEWVIMDMEAGIEHLGRATAQAVDKLIVIVEPGRRSIETAKQIKKLASEISINKVSIVGNKIRNEQDITYLKNNMPKYDFLSFIKYEESFLKADMENISPYDTNSKLKKQFFKIIEKLKQTIK